MAPWANKTGLAKATAILATVLGVSLGLCGMNFFAVISFAGSSWFSGGVTFLAVAGWIELAAIALSFVGLIVVGVMAAVRAVTGSGSEREPALPGDEQGKEE